MRHATDPAAPHKAAAVLGRLAAAGLIAPGEAEVALAAAAADAPGANPHGLRARLLNTFHDVNTFTAGLTPAPANTQSAPPIAAVPAALPIAESIPPRAWLYGTFLVRGYVSVLAAPGGVGKSAYALAVALAVITGRALLGETVHRACPVWVLNLEDPMDELDRRIAALMMAHALTRADIEGRLHLHSGRTRRLVMAELDRASGVIRHPDRDSVIAAIRDRGIGLVVVDPFVKSHGLDENDNRHMDAAATVWAEIAEATGAAILLVHHVRKGAVSDVDAARGAKALTDAARAAAILSPMSEEDARALGVAPGERWRLIRRDDAKANLAPRAARALWLRHETIALGNVTEDYPEGDKVGAVTQWRPRSPFHGISIADCNAALDLIAQGPYAGGRFTANRHPTAADRWVGQALAACFAIDTERAAAIAAAWLRNGVLRESDYADPVQRKTRRGLTVDDTRRPADRI
ncbi:MAG: AAA family ATPase [Alphaproteobacteria bacterium]|nr:AAA family ATPase [Alphaproteobacteria bacterium]